MPSTDAAWAQFLPLVREKLLDRVHDLLMPDDDVGWRLIQRADPIYDAGRKRGGSEHGFWAEWEILLQRSGYVGAGSMVGNTVQQVGVNNLLTAGQALDDNDYLDPTEAPLRSYLGIQIECKKIVGTLAVNETQMEAQMATKPLGQIAGGHIEDQVKHIRNYWNSMLWGDGTGIEARVDYASGYTITESAPVAVAVKEGSPFNFHRGQRYVASSHIATASYGSSPRVARTGSTSTKPAGVMICTNVNKKTRDVHFQSAPGEGSISLSDGDDLMRIGVYDFSAANVTAGSYKCIQGIHGMVKSSGQFPGAPSGVNVEDYSELQGFVDGDYSSLQAPTPELIAEYLDWIDTGGSELPSMIVSERSVQTVYSQYEKANSHVVLVPQGQAVSPNGGVRAPMFSHGGKAFVWPTSRACKPNTIYGMDPGSLVRFMPIGDGSLRWKIGSGPTAGLGTMFRPVLTDGGVRMTKVSEAPYNAYGQLGINKPNMFFIIQGVQSQRDV